MRSTLTSPFNLKKERGRSFIKAVLVDHPSIDLLKLDSDNGKIEVSVECAKLEKDKETGFVRCTIYETRPQVCRDYSCLKNANEKGITLNASFPPRKVIREVHGKEIEIVPGQ